MEKLSSKISKVSSVLMIVAMMIFGVNGYAKSKKEVTIQHIRNATLKIDYAGKSILLDPMLGKKHSFMSFVEQNKNLNPTVDLPFSVDKVTKGTDLILLTHTHLDHFDQKAKDFLDKNIPIYIQPFDKDLVEKSKFKNIHVLNSSTKVGNMEIIRTTGVHGPESINEMLGKVSGFVLKAKNYPTIYIVGDCLLDDVIRHNIETYKPDVVVTNSGGAVFMNETILMGAQETVDVAKMAPEATVVATHMESLDHCKVTRKQIRQLAKKEHVSNILTPKNGETLKLR
ncbi:UPF0173 protein YddR [Fulvitalea axinellae]|uniref:UPF0173 protein YddR n=1 Tax=Fulvitalea axinellae TaxID=1182444 RepID=A0AAU9CQS9_9BACT|nr:UPF0173 protein YddR [Fulvitalea axinellae]